MYKFKASREAVKGSEETFGEAEDKVQSIIEAVTLILCM